MPTYDFQCLGCDTIVDHFVPYERRDDPDQVPLCLVCGGAEHRRLFPAPRVMSASLPDGTKRRGWSDLKEAAKLNVEAAGSKRDTAREIRKEIKRIGVKVEK